MGNLRDGTVDTLTGGDCTGFDYYVDVAGLAGCDSCPCTADRCLGTAGLGSRFHDLVRLGSLLGLGQE